MPELTSASFRLAVQIAIAEARAKGAPLVTNDHLMIGILDLQKTRNRSFKSEYQAGEIRTIIDEFSRLESLLAAFKIEIETLRRTLRDHLVQGSIAISDGNPPALCNMSQMTVEIGSGLVDGSPGTCLSLFTAVLLHPGPGLTAALQRLGISEQQILQSVARTHPSEPLVKSWLDSASAPKPSRFEGSVVESIGELQQDETIFVLDLCGSTPLACKDEKMAYHLKKRLRELSYASLMSDSAAFTQSTGDGWLATFERAAQGISAAKSILTALAERNRKSRNPPIHIRIALHSGRTYLINGKTPDRHGGDINLACRIEGVQAPAFRELKVDLPVRDRILCTEPFLRRYVEETGKADLSPVLCGEADLKGIPKPVGIFVVPW